MNREQAMAVGGAPAAMGQKRSKPDLDELVALAIQYRDDMKYPPEDDSRQRRIEWINHVLGDSK